MAEGSAKQQRSAMLQMLLCASMWSIAGILIKLIPWSALGIAGWRGLLCAGVLMVYVKLSKTPLRIGRRALVTAFFICATSLCFVLANKLTTAANAIVLQFTSPVFILSYNVLFLRQRITRGDIAAVLLTMGGVALFFFDQLAPGHLLGNFVAILAGVFCAGMFISIGSGPEEERVSGTILGHLFTAAVGITAFFLAKPAQVSGSAVLCVVILGVFQLGLPYILFLHSSKHCPPLACNLLSVAEPLLNPVWVFIFDGEAPGLFALLGAVMVIVSVTVWSVHQAKASAPTKEDA